MSGIGDAFRPFGKDYDSHTPTDPRDAQLKCATGTCGGCLDCTYRKLAKLQVEHNRLKTDVRALDERMERVVLANQAFEGGRDANGMELLGIAVDGWRKHEDNHG